MAREYTGPMEYTGPVVPLGGATQETTGRIVPFYASTTGKSFSERAGLTAEEIDLAHMGPAAASDLGEADLSRDLQPFYDSPQSRGSFDELRNRLSTDRLGPFAPGTAGEYSSRGERRPPWAREHVRQQRRVINQAIVQPAKEVAAYADLTAGFPYFIAHVTGQGVASGGYALAGEKEPLKTGRELIEKAGEASWNRFLSAPFQTMLGAEADETAVGKLGLGVNRYVDEAAKYWSEKTGNPEVGELLKQATGLAMAKGVEVATNFFREGTLRLRGKAESKATDVPAGNAAREKMEGLAAEFKEEPSPKEAKSFRKQQTQEKSAPEIPEGAVRYYHGGSPEGVTGSLWFTSDLRDAKGWAGRDPANMGVWYVDVPKDSPARGLSHEEVAAGLSYPQRIEFPAEIAAGRKLLSGSTKVLTKGESPVFPGVPLALGGVGLAIYSAMDDDHKSLAMLPLIAALGRIEKLTDKDFSGRSYEELNALHARALEHNRQVDLEGIEKFFGKGQAKEAESWSKRKREKWLEKNETNDSSDWMQARYALEERIDEYRQAANDFDTDTPRALGQSIALKLRRINDPGFFDTPDGSTVKNAFRFAKDKNWNLDEVVKGMRERVGAWAGYDAPELFERLFRPESAKKLLGALGIGAGIYAMTDDKEKGLAAALPFALAMRQVEPHIPAALRESFERAKLGDEGSLHHLDMMRMELPPEQRALLDPAIHALEEVHFKREGVTITAPIAPIPQDKKDPLFGAIPLAVRLKMPQGTPTGALHKGLRYTTGAEKPISMFGQGGKVDPHLLKIMGGVALAVGAGAIEKQLDPEHDLLRAIETGAGATLVGRLLPRYVEYVKSDFKGAANDTLGVLGKSVLVGALQHDPIAGVATALGLGLWNSQKKIAKSPIVKTTEDLANLFQGGSLRRERQAATFEVGIKSLVPDAGRRDAIFRALDRGDISGLPRDEQVVAKAWLKTSRDLWDEAEKLGLTRGRKFIESYVAHLVEKAGGSPETAQEIVAGLERSGGAEAGKWSPHLQRRFYKTLEDLQAALVGKGLRIKTTDLAEMGSSYIRSMGRAIESERMIQGVKAVKTPKGLGSLLRPESGKGQAPADWPSINSPYMRGFRAHPEVAPHLRWFLEARNSSDAANAFFALNDAIKRVGVSYSLFHAFNLGVAHIGARHGSGISGQANIFAGLSDVAKGWAKQAGIPVDSPLHKALEVYYSGGVGDSLDRGLMAGLRVQPMAEVGVGVGERLAGSIHPILGKAAEIGGKGQAWFDRQTWEFAHPASKIQLFLSEYNYELAKRAKKLGGEERIPEAMKDEVAQTVASYVNEVYGHIDWYRVASEANTKMGQWAAQAITPSAQPWLRMVMFAPDWTISTFRAMWGAFPSAEKPIGSLSWRLHAGYALRTGLMLMTLQNGLNLALSGHNIWDPQQKDPFQVDMGDGRRIQIFKHATEFFEWAQHPVQTLANKSAYPWREVTSQVAKQDYPGGPPMSGLERVGPTAEQRLGHAVKGLLPFPVQPFFDPALTPAEAGTKALLGIGSINIHGMSEEEKARLREKRARLLQKRKEQ